MSHKDNEQNNIALRQQTHKTKKKAKYMWKSLIYVILEKKKQRKYSIYNCLSNKKSMFDIMVGL